LDSYKYKAFISYSHGDEAWADWLHRALETYRVPRYLVGRKAAAGRVGARIAPVFRDREELSTAPSLSENILEALRQSEALIVLCSPASAASRWVNQEIRSFRSLGRTERIFCVVVDGDPGAADGPQCCFPQALFEGADNAEAEPLAADPRPWADGKRRAKLKLIAGLLGVGLDELRQRDLRRRRRWGALVVVAAAAALALTLLAVMSSLSERREREKAEQLATFIVDLGERVSSDVDLETLAIISSEASKHLEGLDARQLSPETSIRVGLAIRQMGRVSEQQGRTGEALEAYQRSRDLFLGLRETHPDRVDILYELGLADYWIGNLRLKQGDYDEARLSLQRYHQAARLLVQADPQNPEWTMELSYSLSGLAALHLDSGKAVDARTLSNLEEAIELIETAMTLSPADHTVIGHYATTLAWAADAHLQACKLDTASSLREKTLELATEAHHSDPSDNDLKRRYAFACFGVAMIQADSGDPGAAEENMRRSISMLQELSAADPSNVLYQEELLWQNVLLAALLGDTGRTGEAKAILESLQGELEAGAAQWHVHDPRRGDFIEYLLVLARLEYLEGKLGSASAHIRRALSMATEAESGQGAIDNVYRLVLARYRWWAMHSEDIGQEFPLLLGIQPRSSGDFRACRTADASARVSLLGGDHGAAKQQAAYLAQRGYAHPSWLRFCRQHGLCL
jgi:tetratricopeptide (TPR) repeat protein